MAAKTRQELYQIHAEKNRAYARERRRANKEALAAKDKEYRAGNAEKIEERIARWRDENRDHLRARQREYMRAHPEMRRAAKANRRARLAKLEEHFTTADVRKQYDAQGGRCYWCGVDVGDKYHADHIIPLARGGGNSAANIVIACPPCNMRKGTKLPEEFLGPSAADGLHRSVDFIFEPAREG